MFSSNECEECGKVFTDSARLFVHQKKSCRAGKRSLRELLSDTRDLWKTIESRPRKKAKLSEVPQARGSKSSRQRKSRPELVRHRSADALPMDIDDVPGHSTISNLDPSSSSGTSGYSKQIRSLHENVDRAPEDLRSHSTSRWTTLRNRLGLFKKFSDVHAPSHNPEILTDTYPAGSLPRTTTQSIRHDESTEVSATSTTQSVDLSGPSGSSQDPPAPQQCTTSQLYPYPNWSSFELGDLFWSHGPTNSLDQFGKLIRLLNDPNFSIEDIRGANWTSIHHRLADGEPPELDSSGKWVDDRGPGWSATKITLRVPFPTRGHGYMGEVFEAGVLHHRRIVRVIKDKLLDPDEHRNRHFHAHQLFWQPDLSQEPIRVYGEAYSSDEFCKMEDEVRGLALGEEDEGLERVVIALMFWTDATLLANFGTAKLWPCYLFFGNDSKYLRAKPGNLCNHMAYFESLPASFKDWYRSHNEGRAPTPELITHCTREIFQRQWDILLDDELVQAMKKGIRIACLDGTTRLFFPRIFTYSADYPEKCMVATIKAMGTAPCPRCLMKKCEMHDMGSEEDSSFRRLHPRIDNAARQEQVRLGREKIFVEGYVVNSTKVDDILKDDSMLPIENAFTKLSPFGFDIHSSLAVDFMHEFELGVWKAIFIHLIRILEAAERKGEGPVVSELDQRYRNTPSFGPDTIRKFSSNASEQKRLAARDYANLLQCAIPAFDGLLPEPHNTIVLQLLLALAEWHAFAKLRMHTEATVDLLETKTTTLATRIQEFKTITCEAYETMESVKEYGARLKRSAKKKRTDPSTPLVPTERPGTNPSSSTAPPEGSTPGEAGPSRSQPPVQPQVSSSILTTSRKGKLRKTLNLQTYKYHALADFAGNIRSFGTTDSYSTERGELEHTLPKSWYPRTNKKGYQRQLARIERRRANLRKIRQSVSNDPAMTSTGSAVKSQGSRKKAIPVVGLFCAYVIAKSQSSYLPLHRFVPHEVNGHDPALKGFLVNLQQHLGGRLEAILRRKNPERFLGAGELAMDPNFVSLVDGRIYTHQTLHITYTAYDGRQGDDIIWPSGSKADIMLLNPCRSSPGEHLFIYGKVLGIYHANVVYVKGCQDLQPERLSFLWVRWYKWQGQTAGVAGLDIVNFPPVTQSGAFGFVDPGDVLRACHIIPRPSVSHKKAYESVSENANDAHDYAAYFANRFADRDLVMRYMWGYAVGHSYTHASGRLLHQHATPPSTSSSQPSSSSQPRPGFVLPSPDIEMASSPSIRLETRDVAHETIEGDCAPIPPPNAEDEMIYERSDVEGGSSDEEEMEEQEEQEQEEQEEQE